MIKTRRGGTALLALAVGGVIAGGIAVATSVGSAPAPVAAELLADRAPTPPTPAPLAPAGPPASPTSAPVPAPTTRPAPPTAGPPTTVPTAATRTPTRAPAAAAAGPAGAVVALVNDDRRAAGCAPLRADAQLARAAQAHSADMARNDYFEHDSRDGRTFADRIEAEGYPDPGGENIAVGQRSAAEVVAAWLDSPGHRRNIEDCGFTTTGVGFDPDGNYWTQDFGR